VTADERDWRPLQQKRKLGKDHCHLLVDEMGSDVDEVDAGDKIEDNEALGASWTCGHDEETPNLVVAVSKAR
jgi:hypothetical protein